MALLREIYEVVSHWESTGEMSNEMARTIDSGFSDFVREELEQVHDILNNGNPHQAFGQLNRLIAILNMTFIAYPYAYTNFNKWIKLLIQTATSIVNHNDFEANKPKVQISIGIPHGFAINISYEV